MLGVVCLSDDLFTRYISALCFSLSVAFNQTSAAVGFPEAPLTVVASADGRGPMLCGCVVLLSLHFICQK